MFIMYTCIMHKLKKIAGLPFIKLAKVYFSSINIKVKYIKSIQIETTLSEILCEKFNKGFNNTIHFSYYTLYMYHKQMLSVRTDPSIFHSICSLIRIIHNESFQM